MGRNFHPLQGPNETRDLYWSRYGSGLLRTARADPREPVRVRSGCRLMFLHWPNGPAATSRPNMMSRGRYRGSSRFSPLYVGFGIGGAILSGALFARLAAYTRQADCPPGPNGYPHNDASRKFRPPRGSGGALHEFWSLAAQSRSRARDESWPRRRQSRSPGVRDRALSLAAPVRGVAPGAHQERHMIGLRRVGNREAHRNNIEEYRPGSHRTS